MSASQKERESSSLLREWLSVRLGSRLFDISRNSVCVLSACATNEMKRRDVNNMRDARLGQPNIAGLAKTLTDCGINNIAAFVSTSVLL